MSSNPSMSAAYKPPPAIRWRCWPLWEHPIVGSLSSAALAAAVLGVAQVTGRMYLGTIAGAALAVSLWRFFVPVVFELNAEGIHQKIPGRHWCVPWNSIGRYEIFTDGVLVLPVAERCAIDALRGLYLPWRDHRDEVLANLEYYLARPDQRPAGA